MCLLHYLLFLSSFVPTPFLLWQISFVLFCCVSLSYFLHAFPVVLSFPLVWLFFPSRNSWCSLFLFIVLLHISFHTHLFIQKDLGLCGPNNIDRIKRVLGPICLNLSKPFYWKTVFCRKFVICYRSAFCCRSLSLALLSLDLSCSSVFLVGLWALLFIGLSSVWAFGYEFKKWASTYIYNLIMNILTKKCSNSIYPSGLDCPSVSFYLSGLDCPSVSFYHLDWECPSGPFTIWIGNALQVHLPFKLEIPFDLLLPFKLASPLGSIYPSGWKCPSGCKYPLGFIYPLGWKCPSCWKYPSGWKCPSGL